MFDIFQKTQQVLSKTRDAGFKRLFHLLERPDDGVWQELEELLILSDVGVKATDELLGRVKGLKGDVRQALMGEMERMLNLGVSIPQWTEPWVILTIGVNGSGKTTSIAKLAYMYKKQGKKVILAAADTFRAAAIEQLTEWGERAGAEVVAHKSGADPAAVVFDAIEAAKHRGASVVIIDTSGRLHTKYNLMEELKKIKRVVQKGINYAPHQVLLVLDATTGQNGLAQARSFTEAVGVNGIFLAKLDGTAKGGIVLAIAQELKIPILYVGTGEGLEDIAPFNAKSFVEALCST